MKISFICIIIVSLLFISGCKPAQISAEPQYIDERYETNDFDQQINELEQEFVIIEENNWEVSPQGYTQIENKMKEVETIDDPRVRILRDKFSLIKVGGAQQNIPTPNEQKVRDNGCTGSGPVTFTASPMKINAIETILPLGLMIGGHVTPIDHGYFNAKTWDPGRRNDVSKFVEVFAPAAGTITTVQSMPSEFSSSDIGDYYIMLHYTCTFYSIFIHVNKLSEKLQSIKDTSNTVQVNAGEVIGYAPAFDFSVHNEDVTLSGFIVPEHYEVEPAKLHTVSIFDYFSEPIKTQLLERNVRQKEPRSGKIDYDVDGKLVGNWFEENTNGYRGKEQYNRMPGYWKTHLAFAYDGLDPDLVTVSIGDYNGEAKQFPVKTNAPDPKKITPSTGLVKYELVQHQYLTSDGKEWDRKSFAKITGSKRFDNFVEGVVLVQMLENRKIKFEAFPGKKAAQITEFTSNAKIYER